MPRIPVHTTGSVPQAASPPPPADPGMIPLTVPEISTRRRPSDRAGQCGVSADRLRDALDDPEPPAGQTSGEVPGFLGKVLDEGV
jgi:hypothetical protein